SAARATLGLYPVPDATGYGLVRRDDDGSVLEFLEKPDRPRPGEINAGTYVLEHSALDLVPDGRMVSIERDVFPRMIGEGLFGIPLEGYWIDIGTPDRNLKATWDILERRVATGLGEALDEDGQLLAEDAQRAAGAEVKGPALVESGVRIEQGATVGPRAALAPGCEIGAGAAVTSSVLLEGCRIGAQASIDGSILGVGVEVEDGARVEAGSVIGAGERVSA
ncbi:MAG: sugar phosphate nucleotidyltransferase, partial [Solirubrobacterales bacterium]